MSSLLQTIADFFKSDDDIKLVIVYGSAASGKTHPGSDMDVAILKSAPLSIERKMEVILQMEEVLRMPVDVIDLFNANGLILKQILTKGQVITKKDSGAYYTLMSKMLDQQTDFQPFVQRLLLERQRRFAYG